MPSTAEHIQILYEISMSIGSSLDLKTMAQMALRAYAKKLNCSAGIIYRTIPVQERPLGLEKVYSIPRSFENISDYQDVLGKSLKANLSDDKKNKDSLEPIQLTTPKGVLLTIFPLVNFGLIILARRNPFDDYLLHSIQALNLKLASAGQYCLQNTELHIKESKYRHIFNGIQDVYGEVDAVSGDILEISPSVFKLTGFTREELLGTPISELYVHDSERKQLVEEVRSKGNIQDFQVSMRTKSGEPRIASFNATMETRAMDNRPIISGTLRDVTTRELLNRDIQYRLKLEKTLVSISSQFIKAEHHEINNVIELALKDLGVTNDVDRVYIFELTHGNQFMDNTHEWCAAGVEPQIDKLQHLPANLFPWWMARLNAGKIVNIPSVEDLPVAAAAEKEILSDQGILSLLSLPINIHNELFGFIGFDSTRQTKSWQSTEQNILRLTADNLANAIKRGRDVEAMQIGRERLELALSSANLGLWDWNIQSGAIVINDNWATMLGYDPDEIILDVSTWEKLIHPDDLSNVQMELDAHLSGKSPVYSVEHRLKTKSGGWKWIGDRGQVVSRDTSGKALRAVGVHMDISVNKEAELAMQKSIKMKTNFVSNVSHELRTPLASIRGSATTILRDKQMTDEIKTHFVQIIENESQRLTRLIEDILDISRMEAGTTDVQMELVQLETVLLEVIESQNMLAEKKNILIEQHIQKSLPPIMAARDAMAQVMTNLISNALKFTESDGQIEIDLKQEGEVILFKVSDTGLGIPKEDLPHIFERFYRVERPKREIPGTGLGLTIVKEIIARHRGRVTANSKLGEGTTFEVRLPFTQSR